MPASNWDTTRQSGSGIVAGYFAKAEDAHRAIGELLKEGFNSGDIGAAFHSSGLRAAGSAEEVNDLPVRTDDEERDRRPSGATSGTEAVSPWGLFTGGGTPFAGASRPGPIPGSEIPSTLPRELPSEFASEHAYSGSAFESSFSGMGIPAEHARRLARELAQGGAVVTIKAGARESVAEGVMQRNHGVIRYESAPTSEMVNENQSSRVQVFGEVHRVYPGYVPGQEQERKAS